MYIYLYANHKLQILILIKRYIYGYEEWKRFYKYMYYVWRSIAWFFYPLANEVAKEYSNDTVRPSHPCEHSRINILQWILTKLGTYLILKKIWNPIDFQGQRSRSRVKFLPHNILVNTLESTSFNGFWPNLVHI